MFIDNPRNNSVIHLAKLKGGSLSENLEQAKKEVNEETNELISSIKNKIDRLSIEKAKLTGSVKGKHGEFLKIYIKTPEFSFLEVSEIKLIETNKNKLDYETLFQRFKLINETEYFIENIELEKLQDNLFIPFKELTKITKK